MVSLVDLLGRHETSETVMVLDQPVEVHSLTLGDIAKIMRRFPAVRQLMAERDVEPSALLEMVPQGAAMVIAAATDNADKEEEIAAAGQLPPGTQIELLAAIFRLSAPGGMVPLFETVVRAAGGAPGRVPAGRSPSQSNGSSLADTSSPTSGDTPQDKPAPSLNSPDDGSGRTAPSTSA